MSSLMPMLRLGTLLGVVVCMSFNAVAAKDLSINMLSNPSFESDGDDAVPWNLGAKLFQRDTSVARTGNTSLRWSNTEPGVYRLTTQQVQLQPGRVYELSGWIKTEQVEGVRESGATIALGYSSKSGEYIKGGPHPGGQKGTGDWWQLVSYAGPIPENVTYGTFTCYVRKRGDQTFTGTAWWDDVVLRPVSLEVRLLQPSYKARVTDESPELEVEFVAWPQDFGLAYGEVMVDLAIVPADKDAPKVFEHSYGVKDGAAGQRQVLTADLSALEEGKYDVYVSLRHIQSGQTLWRQQRTIHRVAQSNRELRVHFDEHHRMIVDGKPFFPIGVYSKTSPVDVLAGTPFNCFMSYGHLSGSQMDAAHDAGLKVIYSVKDYFNKIWYSPGAVRSIHDEVPAIRKVVEQFRDHPSLLAWYVNDELGPECLVEHRAHYRLLNEEDPHHPAWSLHYKPEEMSELLDTADIIGIDTYPVPDEPLAKVADDMQATVQAVRGRRPVWSVPQIFSWAVFRDSGRPPTLGEMRNMAWQAICNGAGGLIFYSLHQVQKDDAFPFEPRWRDIQTMAGEVAEYAEILTSIEEVPALRVSNQPWLHWTARRVDNTLYFFAVSDAGGAGEFHFEVDSNVRGIDRKILGESPREAIKMTQDGQWHDRLESGAVHVYRIDL